MERVFLADHAFKHGLSEIQIRHAWKNFLAKQHRSSPNEEEIVLVGCDAKGNLIQIVAIEKTCGILIYHAMTPPTRKVLSELGLYRRWK